MPALPEGFGEAPGEVAGGCLQLFPETQTLAAAHVWELLLARTADW